MAFSSQQAVPFGQRLLLRFSLPARRLWRRALLRPIGSAEGAGPRALCPRGLAAWAVASSPMGGFHYATGGALRAARRVPRVAFAAGTQASSLRDIGWGAVGVGGAEGSRGERSGGVLGMTHAPGCLGTAGAWEFVLAEANGGLCECGQLRRRRVALRPADARSASEPGAGTTPKYMLSAVT